MSTRSDRPEALLLCLFGALVWVGFAWNFYRELQELGAFLPPVMAFALGSVLSLSVVYAGYDISRDDRFDAVLQRRVVGWGVGGAVLAGAIDLSTILIRRAEGRIVAEPQLDLLVSVAGGLLAGILVGHGYTRARQSTIEARDRRDALAFLNSALRHELLNGLNVVHGYTDRLREHAGDGGEIRRDVQGDPRQGAGARPNGGGQQTAINTIETRIEDMTEVVENARALSETFTAEAEPTPVDLSAVLERRIALARESHPDAVIEADVPDDLRVAADETVRYVFENLLRNAILHNDKPTPEVTVIASTDAETVSVRVADNGPGISDDRKDAIFERDPDRVHGFGLYLVERLVTVYCGDIEVADNEPEGAVFTVTLPRAETDV